MLKLTAAIGEGNDRGATIHICWDDYALGFVHAKAEHADELANLLNAATELLEELKELEAAAYQTISAEYTEDDKMLDEKCAVARTLIAKAEGAT